MSFNINDVMKDILSEAERVFEDEWPKVKRDMERVLADEQEAIESIANAYIEGGIDEEEFKEQLESERDAFEAGVAMCRVSSKVTIQQAVNAALGVFEAAVKAVVF